MVFKGKLCACAAALAGICNAEILNLVRELIAGGSPGFSYRIVAKGYAGQRNLPVRIGGNGIKRGRICSVCLIIVLLVYLEFSAGKELFTIFRVLFRYCKGAGIGDILCHYFVWALCGHHKAYGSFIQNIIVRRFGFFQVVYAEGQLYRIGFTFVYVNEYAFLAYALLILVQHFKHGAGKFRLSVRAHLFNGNLPVGRIVYPGRTGVGRELNFLGGSCTAHAYVPHILAQFIAGRGQILGKLVHAVWNLGKADLALSI